MAHIHQQPVQTHERTVIEEREGSATALIAILLVIATVFLVWLFAFSGWVFERNDTTADQPRIEQHFETDGGTGGSSSTTDDSNDQAPSDAPQDQPTPASSP